MTAEVTGVDEIEALARDWALRLAARPDDEDLRHAAWTWRRADARHDAAFSSAQRIWALIGETPLARGTGWRREAEELDRATQARRRRNAWIVGVPALAASLLLVAFGVALHARAPFEAGTGKAQERQIALQDGSRVDLAADSELSARFDRASRRVVLTRGEAFFDVVHDPSRPFTVVAGDAEIRVLGTKFDVHRIGDKVIVTVLEGRVEVRRHHALAILSEPKPETVLTRGDVATLAPEVRHFETQTPVAPEAVAAWRKGRLTYVDTPLADIITDANRYSSSQILLKSEDVGDLRVTVSFRTDQVEKLIPELEQALPVRATRNSRGEVVLAAR